MTALLDTAAKSRARPRRSRAEPRRSHDRRERFAPDDSLRLEKAARRVLRAYGYGSAWAPTLYQADVERMEAEGEGAALVDAMRIARRGRAEELAVRSDEGKVTQRAFRGWSAVGGGRWVAIAATNTDRIGLAALTQVEKPLDSLLVAYSIESAAEWLKVEAYFSARAVSPHWRVALRDAMTRIMFGARATGIEARARELSLKTQTFRELTRSYEQAIRDRLAIAAALYLAEIDALSQSAAAYLRTPRLSGSQGGGTRSATWWIPAHAVSCQADAD
ncbi:hypothetical protein DX912_10200 [Lysobacter soli]|uniref:Uncharacterized protein n=1 Tax=Lysobacter soli TaxID=453783 RepID=A0A3D8VCA0_9GAMM|nr:hypothetical protein [Lysobacter soli]RDY67044.1 hypothetical protein DX912_10200 [Lysobacter soli]